jgi:DNA modification methylase
MSTLSVSKRFSNVEINPNWSFEEHRSTARFTHGYHRYPAKFVPHLVKKLIINHTNRTDVIADVFAGCGTTLVESKLHGRKSIGIDVNPIAKLITQAKITPLDNDKIEKRLNELIKHIGSYRYDKNFAIVKHDRIDYWFGKREKQKIAFLYSSILLIKDKKLQTFFLCALSNILKTSSKWLQTSTKPQIDPNKKPLDPFIAFKQQVKQMLKKNNEYFSELEKRNSLNTDCKIIKGDARKTKLKTNSINVIITSPPYVTSYEYADIHQLTGYWFEYISDIAPFRRKFIGTFYSNNKIENVKSSIAQNVVNELKKENKRMALEVANYFTDMYQVAKEMKRILKKEGKVCLVIGNTSLYNVKIKTAEVFVEYLMELKFRVGTIIKRKIPMKLIPTIRDKTTGRFTTKMNSNKKLVYPEEYIIIARKK